MILGPFQGKVACTNIEFGRGVCGTAAAAKQTVVVAKVKEFEGHIACDSASESEIVVPLLGQDGVSQRRRTCKLVFKLSWPDPPWG